jgi:hypothetical protein
MLSMIVATMLPMFTLATNQDPASNDLETECTKWAEFLKSNETLNSKLKKIDDLVNAQLKMDPCCRQYIPASNLILKIETFANYFRRSCAQNRLVSLTKNQKLILTNHQYQLITFLEECIDMVPDKNPKKASMSEMALARPGICKK